MRSCRTVFVAAQLLLALCVPAVAAGVKDPLASVRALYGLALEAQVSRAGVSRIYALGSLALRLRLMGSGVCTFPMRTRSISCVEIVDPQIDGARSWAVPPVFSQTAPDKETRIVTVTVADASGPQTFSYRFAQTGSLWALEDVAAMGAAGWSLTAITGGERPKSGDLPRNTPRP